jgi:hypothetical protein
MTRFRWIAALGAALLMISVNLTPLAGPQVSALQVARADGATQTVDATPAWNQVCARWEFPSTAAMPLSATFSDAWNSVPNHTLTFDQASAGITHDVNSLMGAVAVPVDGDELMTVTIRNWPVN